MKKLTKSQQIAEATGWSEEKVQKELARVKEFGVTPNSYLNNKAWNMDDKELTVLGAKCKDLAVRRKEYLNTVMAEADWTEAYARKQINTVVDKLGTTWSAYANNELWYLDADEMPATLAAAKRAAARRKEYVKTVCEGSGWDANKARDALSAAAKVGMNGYYYCRYQAWNLSDEEISQMAGVIAKRKAQQRESDEWYVSTCAEKSGKSREEVLAHMQELKAQGISFQRYAANECYNMTPEQIERVIRLQQKDASRVSSNKEMYIEKICQATGWTPAKVEIEVAKAKLACGASYEDYFVFRFFDIPPEKYHTYVTFGLFSQMRAKYNRHGPGRQYFDDKAEFNRTFSDLINRRWFVNRDLSYSEFLEKIDGLDAVLAKKLTATQGKGIQKFNCNVPDKRALYDEIMALPLSIVEQYIVQHPDVMAFCDTSVNTLRITTLNANGKCNYLYAVFRMGRGDVVDNFHAGGIAAAVDMRTGVVITHATDVDGNVYPVNPYSNLAMRGFQIPHWDKILETCEKAYNRVPGVNLIGWDFAITPDGVDLIEGNPGASYVVAQIPYVQHRVGLRDVMVDPYL